LVARGAHLLVGSDWMRLAVDLVEASYLGGY
jgi:hypothetical protein